MLTFDSLQQFHEVIAADRICRKVSSPILPVPGAFYSQLVSWMMEHMEEMGCQGMTKYLAKIYLDSYLLQQSSVPTVQLQLLGIAAIKLAVKVLTSIIKFNESFDYLVATAVIYTDNQYSASEILAGEQLLLQTLKFKLKVTTPFCYIKTVRELVPLNNEAIFTHLNLLIEYCSMLPELVGLSSGEVFFAVFVYLCKIKESPHVRSVLLALSCRWPTIEVIAEQIGTLLEQDNQNNPEDECDSSMLVEE